MRTKKEIRNIVNEIFEILAKHVEGETIAESLDVFGNVIHNVMATFTNALFDDDSRDAQKAYVIKVLENSLQAIDFANSEKS